MSDIELTFIEVLIALLLMVVSVVGALMGRTIGRLERSTERVRLEFVEELRETRTEFVDELKGLRADVNGMRGDMASLTERVRATEVQLDSHLERSAGGARC